MPNVFYTLIIFPIEQIIELCYFFALRFTNSSGFSIIVLSAAISTIILPIYLMAENKQKAERDKQKQMKGKIDKIKAVFKGDERYMLTSTFYRQNNYHPIYALRNSIDLFIQIPFFIAAYHFLHNLEALNGQSFIFFKDLGAPDRLLGNINLLPILMTVVNCVSGMIYSRGLLVKEKIQLYGTALVFLVLLYNSPSALVLYWTCNNIYNLVKNIILKNDKLKKLIYPAVILLICCLIAYILLFPRSIGILRRIAAVFLAGLLIFLLFKNKIMEFCGKKIKLKSISVEHTGKIFALSVTGLFLLIGLVIPSSLIASSVEEFAFRKPFSSPLPFVGITFLQSAGILFWLVCIYAIFTKQVRLAMTFLLTIVLGIFMVNVFCFRPDYGFMTPDLKFSNFHSVSSMYKLINIIILLTGAVVITLLFMVKKEKLLLALQSIIILSLIGYGTMNIFRINNNFTMLNTGEGRTPTSDNFNGFNKSYTFSKTGKNVLLIMLDRAISGYVPYIFEEKPELLDSFKGFIYYPNTISFGSFTIYGVPGIFGGYYYTPLEIQKRKNELWIKKYHESMQVLPRIMADSGFMVTVHNQPYMDIHFYDNINNITVDRYYDYLTHIYLENNNDIEFFDYYKLYY
jgi:YidC/Oxa1 family membrane protein insertase